MGRIYYKNGHPYETNEDGWLTYYIAEIEFGQAEQVWRTNKPLVFPIVRKEIEPQIQCFNYKSNQLSTGIWHTITQEWNYENKYPTAITITDLLNHMAQKTPVLNKVRTHWFIDEMEARKFSIGVQNINGTHHLVGYLVNPKY